MWQWKEESGSTITNQMRRLGVAADWSRERFTMDEGLSAAVRKVFVDWYRAGLIYRGNRLVNWDPVLGTAVSDLEVNNVERDGHMWSIRYPVTGSDESIVVATTRPETMLGDVAVAVHPDDERYQHLVGKTLTLPLSGRQIPVIADDYVDKEFGTGCVKITPAHDFNDYAIGQRHKLAPIEIFTLDAKVNGNAPAKYQGMDRYDARKAVLADLDAAGLLVETKPHKLQVPVSQRSDAVIEPMLTDQWFVDLTSDTQNDGRPGGRKAITEPALDAVRSGEIKFVPENWSDHLHAVAGQHPGLVHQPPAVVGPSHSGVVRRSRQHLRRRKRSRRACACERRAGRCAAAGRGRARHLVQLRAVAVLHARLAGRMAR